MRINIDNLFIRTLPGTWEIPVSCDHYKLPTPTLQGTQGARGSCLAAPLSLPLPWLSLPQAALKGAWPQTILESLSFPHLFSPL